MELLRRPAMSWSLDSYPQSPLCRLNRFTGLAPIQSCTNTSSVLHCESRAITFIPSHYGKHAHLSSCRAPCTLHLAHCTLHTGPRRSAPHRTLMSCSTCWFDSFDVDVNVLCCSVKVRINSIRAYVKHNSIRFDSIQFRCNWPTDKFSIRHL